LKVEAGEIDAGDDPHCTSAGRAGFDVDTEDPPVAGLRPATAVHPFPLTGCYGSARDSHWPGTALSGHGQIVWGWPLSDSELFPTSVLIRKKRDHLKERAAPEPSGLMPSAPTPPAGLID